MAINNFDIEAIVYLYYTRGILENTAKAYSYKSNVEKADRYKLEAFVIKKLKAGHSL